MPLLVLLWTVMVPELGVQVSPTQLWPPVVPVQPVTCQVQLPAGRAARILKFLGAVEEPAQKASWVKVVPVPLWVNWTRTIRSRYGLPLLWV